jgi:hypothetical protein
MKIEIEFDVLTDTKMSADDYTYLYIVYKKGFTLLNNLNLKPDLEKLQQEGYVKLGESPASHTIRQEFIDLFISDFDAMFSELCGTYPFKVNSPGRGVRVLHAVDPDAKSNAKAKSKYKSIVGGKAHKHRYIMKCLDKQLTVDKHNLGYLQNLEVWLNNHTWEKYEDLNEQQTENGEQGQRPRITRTL